MVDVEGVLCPVCMDDMTITDINFRPCPCGFQICGFCFHRIDTSDNPQCPSCRAKYKKENIQFTAPDEKEIQRLLRSSKKAKKKNRNNLSRSRKEDTRDKRRAGRGALSQSSPGHLEDFEDRSHLKGMRVVQRNLVYITNLPIDIAEESVLLEPQYFGQYGQIVRIAVTVKQLKSGEKCAAAYVTFEDLSGYSAYHCIRAVDGASLGSRSLRAAFGTTKYCSNFLRNLKCKKAGCTFLHHMGEANDTLSPAETATGKHYEIFQEMSANPPAPNVVDIGEGAVRLLPPPGTFTKEVNSHNRGNNRSGGKRGARGAKGDNTKANHSKHRNKRGSRERSNKSSPTRTPVTPVTSTTAVANDPSPSPVNPNAAAAAAPVVTAPAPIVVIGGPEAPANKPAIVVPSSAAGAPSSRLVIGPAANNLIIGPPSPFMLDASSFVSSANNSGPFPLGSTSATGQQQQTIAPQLAILTMPPIRKSWDLIIK